MKKTTRRDWAALFIALFHITPIAVNQFAPNMIEGLSLSISMTEFILSLNAITGTIFLLISGNLNEKFGMRKTTFFGLGLVILSGLIPIFFKNEVGIILNRLILGTGIGIYGANSSTFIGIFNSGDKKAKLLGYRNAFEMIGLILAIFISGSLGKNDFYMAFVVYIIALFPLIFFMTSIPEIEIDNKEEDSKFSLSKIVIYYSAISLIVVMSMNAMNLRFPTVLSNNGVHGESISLYTMSIMFVGMVGGFAYGKFFKIFRAKTLRVSLFMVLLACILISITDRSIILLVLGVAIATFFQSVTISYLVGDLANHMASKHIAKATGIIFASNNLGTFIAPLVLLTIKNITGFTGLTRVFLGIAAILSLFLIYDIFFFKDSKRSR